MNSTSVKYQLHEFSSLFCIARVLLITFCILIKLDEWKCHVLRSITLAQIYLEFLPLFPFLVRRITLSHLNCCNKALCIDMSWWEEVSCTRSKTLAYIFVELFPVVILSCSDYYSCSAPDNITKFHLWPNCYK